MRTTYAQKSGRASRLRASFVLAVFASFTAVMPFGFSAENPASSFVAHEWGTFTSVQGSDGVLLDWNGAETGDLPKFVHSSTRPGLNRVMGSSFAKGLFTAWQRMETPVIYFYAPEPKTVDVAVQFPQGFITEWFPQALEVGPSGPAPLGVSRNVSSENEIPLHLLSCGAPILFPTRPVTNSLIRWRDFKVLPAKEYARVGGELPTSPVANHYFAARETDAAFVSVGPLEVAKEAEVEKFLFYRGVGRFETALKVTTDREGRINVANTGATPLKHLFALTVRGGRAAFQRLDRLDSSTTHTFDVSLTSHNSPASQVIGCSLVLEQSSDIAQDGLPVAHVVEHLERQMADALMEQGLYPREAEAMVKTWRDSWLQEQGTRVLYVLPRDWTDRILPITINPQPGELVRVMVGRAEVITPDTQSKVWEAITLFTHADAFSRQHAVEQFQALQLGRFAAPAIKLALGKSPNPAVQKKAAELLQAAKRNDVVAHAAHSQL